MRSLTAEDILRLWEWGPGQHSPGERALALLSRACPEETSDQLCSLSIGQRDAQLLTLREQTFGSAMQGFAECPDCGEGLELAMSVWDVRAGAYPNRVSPALEQEVDLQGYILSYRLPNSADLIAIGTETDAVVARNRLLERCIVHVSRDGKPLDPEHLPDSVVTKVAECMSESDPQAEAFLAITCPSCGHRWDALFDINEYFWMEIADHAKRLLRAVHALARAYCWREADILAMSGPRRQWYLEMLGA